jgi:hypothetical protein
MTGDITAFEEPPGSCEWVPFKRGRIEGIRRVELKPQEHTMSDYARLQEENLALKAQIEAGTKTASTAKTSADAALQAKVDRMTAALQDIADGSETKGDMKDIAAKALAGK